MPDELDLHEEDLRQGQTEANNPIPAIFAAFPLLPSTHNLTP